MRKLKLLIVFLVMSRLAAAQELVAVPSTGGVETVHSVKAAILGVSYAYERPLSPRTTLTAEFMLAGALAARGGTGRSTSYFFALAPIVVIEPRYYYSFLKRVNKGQNTANNSANYLALGVDYVFGTTVGDRMRVQRAFSVVPKWGLRRALGQRFFFETAIGMGVQKRAYYNWEPTLGLDIKFGYALSRRREMK